MGKPKAPAPPDPKETGAAATGTNIGTAIANNSMGMVNQVTPDGSLTYNQTGTYKYTDPYTGKSYDLPNYTATTSLSETGAKIKGQNDAASLNMAETANNQSAFLKDYLGEPWNPDTSAIEGRLWDLGSERLNPQFAREEDRMRTRLANQGVTEGSEAYNREMDRFSQTKNDAFNSLMLTGRGQAFNELQTMRDQPINEITALLSGSRVNNPNVSMAQPQGAATTDVAGLINQNYNQRLGAWQQDMSNKQTFLGGLFGLGAGALRGGLF